MNPKISLEDRIRYIQARIRNMIHYRLTVEERLWDTRFRCQYVHPVRKLRTDLILLVGDMSADDPRREKFIGVVKLIHPKVKSSECLSTLRDIEEYYGNQ